MANIEDLKKIAEEKGVELTEEMLEAIAGGMTTEEWNSYSPEEQAKLQEESIQNMIRGLHCILQDKG